MKTVDRFLLFGFWVLLVGLLATGCGEKEVAESRGELTQPCFSNGSCNAGLTCGADKTCQECAPGLEGCGCEDFWRCGDDLVCQRDICVSFACDKPGALGCACDAGKSCDDGLTCSPNGQCLECSSDLAGCPCSAAGTCGSGLVCNGAQMCERDPALGTRLVDQCYSPCRGDVVGADGKRRHCNADGLMPGCVGNTECVQGSCVPQGQGPRTCSTETECPDFQTCEFGQCYSTCQGNNDCGGGAVCHKHVCRQPCSATSAACAQGNYCHLVDGVAGYCMPLGPDDENSGPTSINGPTVYAELSTSPSHLGFDSARMQNTTRLTNEGRFTETFIVRKQRHVKNPDEAGSTDLSNQEVVVHGAGEVLPWLELGVDDGATSTDQELTITLDPGKTVVLSLVVKKDKAPERWEGEIAILAAEDHAKMAPKLLFLNAKGSPTGRWAGTAYYFTSFGTNGLEEWTANKTGVRTETVGNAFVQQWRKFLDSQKTGQPVAYTRFQEVMQATITESWDWPSVKNICPPGELGDTAICYLSGVSQGFQYYTQSPGTNPVPSGVTELPIALNLRIDPKGNSRQLIGRIDSGSSLHYPGNPQIRVAFAAEPNTCPNQGVSSKSTCAVPMEQMASTVIISGRTGLQNASDNCASATNGRTFVKAEYPWLVPGFLRATQFDSGLQSHFKYECRGEKYPYGPGETCTGNNCRPVESGGTTTEEAALNALLSQANPVADGLQRVRRLELVDGALIDGNKMMVIFKETLESFMGEDGASGVDFEVYGFMVLNRTPMNVANKDFAGVDLEKAAPVKASEATLTYQCSADFVKMVDETKKFDALSPEQIKDLASIMLDGHVQTADIAAMRLADNSWTSTSQNTNGEKTHYLCKYQVVEPGEKESDPSTRKIYGVFNQGFNAEDSYCPEDAEITFFTLDNVKNSEVRNLSCQKDRSCHNLFNQWVSGSREYQDFGTNNRVKIGNVLRTEPYFECKDNSALECSGNRYDLREDKYFYQESETLLYMKPIESEINEAFRFRTQFLSRDNTALGFAPDICAPNAKTTPFCYDPAKIEEIRDRVDCMMSIYTRKRSDLGTLATGSLVEKVRNYLRKNFSEEIHYRINGNPNSAACTPGPQAPWCEPVSRMGFERLYAELLIMLGDEAYTEAFASRFDLAQSRGRTFYGQKFEGTSQGINLSGGVGAEMFNLYQAVQYHQLVLDRFYALSKGIHYSLSKDLGGSASRQQESFITPKMVTLYFDRLIKSSTQKARAYNEISKHYVQLNRPMLARRVIERGYVSAYLESIIFSRLMDSFGNVTRPEDLPQISQVLQRSQTSYKVALLDMRTAHREISDDRMLFGFAPDYIPFPVLGAGDANAFERAMGIAEQRSSVAGAKEILALTSQQSQKVGMAQFQNELNAISINYEGELQELCGTVQGTDGMLYPAIPKYVEFFKDAGVLGALDGDNEELRFMRQLIYQDPCGRFGTGAFFKAQQASSVAELEYQVERQKWKNILTSIDLANDRVTDFCGLDFDFTKADGFDELDSKIGSLARKIADTEDAIDEIDRIREATLDSIGAAADCVVAIASASADITQTAKIVAGVACGANTVATVVAHAATQPMVKSRKKTIRDDTEALSALEGEMEVLMRKWEHDMDCEVAQIDLTETIGNLAAQILTQKIELQKSMLNIEMARSEVQGIAARVQRLIAEYRETENLAINLAAAENDPNVRIYKNDAVINADRTFQSALEATYKATKVFEYYTGQSYAALDKLFLVRTVTFGDYSLESYLSELQDAYIEFQESFGVPDTRVMIVSVRDDIFQALLYDQNGMASSQQTRDEDFRRMLTDQNLLNDKGYISIPFATALSQTSPLTHNHKITKMQAEFVYAGETDALARLYVRQKGTGIVRTADSNRNMYRFPERTAVINPFYNGRVRQMSAESVRSDELDQDIYKTLRFRDLPLVNTSWEMVLNLRNEQVNMDIVPDNLKDIRLYVYYTDFTNLN